MAFEAAFGVTAVLSAILAMLYVRSRKAKDETTKSNIRLEERLKAAEERERDMPAKISDLSADVLRRHGEAFKSTTTDPLGKIMEDIRTRMESLGRQNAVDREAFDSSMKNMAETTSSLLKGTQNLSDVLRNSQRRGRHAEIGLERVFEMSGLTKGVHYDTQDAGGDGRPDFVVRLSEDRSIVVDSKAPLESLWKAFDTDDEAAKSAAMDGHARAVRDHINTLSKRGYGGSTRSSLDYVIMVMPEYSLLPALDRDGRLVETAFGKRVVLVTPSTLMILLRAVDLMWKQSEIADAVREVGELSADLHSRLNTFAEHYNDAGKGLAKAVERYNRGIGSWNRRVMPAADKLAKTGAVTDHMTELRPVEDSPGSIDGRSGDA